MLGTISDAHINNSVSLLNQIININLKNKLFVSVDIKSLYTDISGWLLALGMTFG